MLGKAQAYLDKCKNKKPAAPKSLERSPAMEITYW